ncbi:MAG: hypothetical protein ACPF9E_09080 [Alteromonas oceani]
MDNRAIYLIMFTLSALLSLAIKLNREDYTGIHGGLDILLGSVMSYLYSDSGVWLRYFCPFCD